MLLSAAIICLYTLSPQSPGGDAPFLDIDLEWDLPDFATIGNTIYVHMHMYTCPCTCVDVYYRERMSAEVVKEHVTPFFQNPNTLCISTC